MIAALFVEPVGVYSNVVDVDAWPIERDARRYAGPWPVVAHPDCKRWGRFWHGSTRKPHQFKLGDDDGCFEAALRAVRTWGGVLEHPADSHAWRTFGLNVPPRSGGWVSADFFGGWTCYVEQGWYGHMSRKPTWLYACHVEPPPLRWGRGEQRLHAVALAKHGYEKARRIGMMAMIGGKDKTKIRNATPVEFRDLLIAIASNKQALCRTLMPMSDAQFDAMLEHPPICAFWSGDDGAKCTCGRRYLSIKDEGGNHTGYWKDTESEEVVTFDDAY